MIASASWALRSLTYVVRAFQYSGSRSASLTFSDKPGSELSNCRVKSSGHRLRFGNLIG
jgi:hypothetical protein